MTFINTPTETNMKFKHRALEKNCPLYIAAVQGLQQHLKAGKGWDWYIDILIILMKFAHL